MARVRVKFASQGLVFKRCLKKQNCLVWQESTGPVWNVWVDSKAFLIKGKALSVAMT